MSRATGSPNHKLLAGLALGAFALQTVTNLLGGYGYFIDELYYVACAKRLAWGYVDHPPFAPFLLRLSLSLFGESIAAVRFLPAVCAGVAAYGCGWLAAFFGGGSWAQAVAAITVVLSPVYLVFFDTFSMNPFEVLFWTAAAATLLLMRRTEDARLWLVFGAISGVGLLNKHTMGTLGFALVLGLLLSPGRKLLFNRWLLLGGIVAFVLFVPNLLWQWSNGFPSLEFYRNASTLKNLPSPPLTTLADQILAVNPVVFPLWTAGLFFALRDRQYRFFGLAYLILLTLLVVSQQSRPDRMAGTYPVLFAAGAAFWERSVGSRVRTAYSAVLVAGLIALVPMFHPVLPPEQASRFVTFIGIDTQMEQGEGKRAALPQWLADRFGWEALVAQVEAVYHSLPAEEQTRALVAAPSYGHAGAFELLSDELPPVISGHNTYHMWSREHLERLANGVVIAVGWDEAALRATFGDVQQVGVYTCEFCMSWRNGANIHVARQPKLTLSELEEAWELSKHYE